jgi:hypothetical protein
MDQMKSRLMLAVVLGILLGLGLAYSPPTQPTTTTARPQMVMQPIAQGNVGAASTNTALGVTQILIPLLVGLLFAAPVFLLARRRSK